MLLRETRDCARPLRAAVPLERSSLSYTSGFVAFDPIRGAKSCGAPESERESETAPQLACALISLDGGRKNMRGDRCDAMRWQCLSFICSARQLSRTIVSLYRICIIVSVCVWYEASWRVAAILCDRCSGQLERLEESRKPCAQDAGERHRQRQLWEKRKDATRSASEGAWRVLTAKDAISHLSLWVNLSKHSKRGQTIAQVAPLPIRPILFSTRDP